MDVYKKNRCHSFKNYFLFIIIIIISINIFLAITVKLNLKPIPLDSIKFFFDLQYILILNLFPVSKKYILVLYICIIYIYYNLYTYI